MCRRRVLAAIALAVTLAGCSAEVVDGSGRLAAGGPGSSAPASGGLTSASPSLAPSSPPSGAPATLPPGTPTPGPPSESSQVSPGLALLRTLRAVTSETWVPISDPATGTSFTLPARVSAQQRTQSGVAQRIYQYEMTKQSIVSVSFVRTPSAAAATALLRLYPQQLAASFRGLGVDDAAVSEQSPGRLAGLPAMSFRFAFTPTTVPQIKPVWLATAVASGATVVLLQSIVFPPSNEYDLVPLVRRAQEQLVGSFRAG